MTPRSGVRLCLNSVGNSLLESSQHCQIKDKGSVKMMSPAGKKFYPEAENLNPNVSIHWDEPVLTPVKSSAQSTLINGTATIGSHKDVEKSTAQSDSSVKVVARIRPTRPTETQDCAMQKMSSNSLLVKDRLFALDSVLDATTTQEDIFHLVGPPLVKNSLAGYHTSVITYGQSGSGKTYTLWGPPSAMVEQTPANPEQGIVPRVFSMLFSEIHKQQENILERLTNYQCRCSFLEIHNEKIIDLLNPALRDLEIKDDRRSDFYVENLTEEYVNDYDDVIMALIKGLSNRKVGATSTNSKSSRSHVIFSCVIESWSKGISSRCVSSSKCSRINFVDLAGSDKKKINNIDRQSKKEINYINRSLSRKVVKILAEPTYAENMQGVPHKASCLTRMLEDALGGNAKLIFVCTISSDIRCMQETASTLRFAQRVKQMKNRPLINEITEDAVNDLGDQIRQLKEDLIRAKSGGINSMSFKNHCTRGSLNQLRSSLNRSLFLTCVDHNETEVHVDEKDLKDLCEKLENVHSKNSEDISNRKLQLRSSKGLGLQKIKTSVDHEVIAHEGHRTSYSSGFLQDPPACVSSQIMATQIIEDHSIKRDNPTSMASSIQRGLQIIGHPHETSHTDKYFNDNAYQNSNSQIPTSGESRSSQLFVSDKNEGISCPSTEDDLVNGKEGSKSCLGMSEKEELLTEIQRLNDELKAKVQLSRWAYEERNCVGDEFEKERQRWIETESKWICLTEELRIDLENNRRAAEKMRSELKQEKKCSEELDDALSRSIMGHARIVEQYSELQEKYNDLLWKHRMIMEGIADVKKAMEKAGAKGARSSAKFVESLAAELSTIRVEREKERAHLKKENRDLKIQMRDTAEAVHAAGELLVKLREAEETTSIAQEENLRSKQEMEKMKKKMEKMKKKHAMEMLTLKHYLGESRLPEPALGPILQRESSLRENRTFEYADDQDWRSEFGPSYGAY